MMVENIKCLETGQVPALGSHHRQMSMLWGKLALLGQGKPTCTPHTYLKFICEPNEYRESFWGLQNGSGFRLHLVALFSEQEPL